MTHTIEIAPEIEQQLEAEAARTGTTADSLIAAIVERGFAMGDNAAPDIAEEFHRLVEWWERETWPYSSVEKICTHPAYQRIIGLGPSAVPLILAELQKEPHHYFWALTAITGDDPIADEHAGCMQEMADDWLRWGIEHGYFGQA
jgi:hypothetical protein